MNNCRDALQRWPKDFFVSEVWNNSETESAIRETFDHMLALSLQVLDVGLLANDALHLVAPLQRDKKSFEPNVPADTCDLALVLATQVMIFRLVAYGASHKKVFALDIVFPGIHFFHRLRDDCGSATAY